MFYQYRDTKIYYEEIGSGKPIIILHGLGCNMDLMKGCLEPLFTKNKHYKRIYVDLPGMGASEAHLHYAAADAILEILQSFLTTITDDNVLLVGESYGGYLARGLLAKLQNRVDGLFLLCPVIIPNASDRLLPKRLYKFYDKAYLDSLDENEKQSFCEYAIIANQQTHQRYRTEILPGLKLADPEFIARLCSNYSFAMELEQEIKNVIFDKPALFLCGRQDNCVGYQDVWNILENYPRATFSVLDTAGHNLQIEQPALFETLVDNWLLRVEKFSKKPFAKYNI